MKPYLWVLFCIVILAVSGCKRNSFSPDVTHIEIGGVENFYRVSPVLYRSGQPDSTGLVNLEKMGIKTIVNLRRFPGKRYDHTAIEQVLIPMLILPLDENDVIQYIQIVTAPEQQPVLVHCLRGSDRTGAMVAIYRIVVQDWSKEKAVQEMVHGGFGYQRWLFTLPRWINNIDVEAIRESAGLVKSSSGEYIQERCDSKTASVVPEGSLNQRISSPCSCVKQVSSESWPLQG